jgi:PPK2 family polyphosphate:nucleotide phosphotransferase
MMLPDSIPRSSEADTMPYATKIKPGKQVDLAAIDPGDVAGLDKERALPLFQQLGAELRELQELLFGASSHSVLVVLQGIDTSGKDGTIKSVFDYVNPQGIAVTSFKVPTPRELSQDFLWRVHPHAPPRGQIAIFNRSHYEDVLVVRVHELAPAEAIEARYEHINSFERLLADSNTLLIKFMLHISKKEQEERLLEREQEPEKAWKLAAGDWRERERWDEYVAAYERALGRCSSAEAPWYVVPANKKWFRNLAVMETLVETLRPYRDDWVAALAEQGARAKEELAAYRAEQKAKK